MSAPDRIWAMPSDDGWMSPYCGNAPHDGSTEYVRADLCDPMQDARMKRLVDLLNEPVVTHTDQWWIDARNAALRALGQGEG